METGIVKATEGPKHHLFGFHDLVAFNASGEKILSLEADVINRPPLPNEEFGVGYVMWKEQRFVKLGTTKAMNYPQGARQQWIDNGTFIVNNMVGDHWGADIYDVLSGKKTQTVDGTCHILSKDKTLAYGINYSRLHRLGGYGYIGLDDKSANQATPADDGIFVTELATNKTRLLVSIADVAKCDPSTCVQGKSHSYLTHLVLSPDGKRIAFLHRAFLPDGGIRTRLMTVGVEGNDIHCLAVGFLSHFYWYDNEHIFIWGRAGSNVDAMRSNPVLSNPLVKPLLHVAKSIVKTFIGKSNAMSMHFLMCKDSAEKEVAPFAQGIITEDGHPMCSPIDNNLMICDTYPDQQTRCRTLFFYKFKENERIDVRQFRMLDDKPDITLFKNYSKGVDADIMEKFSPDLFSFTRSGLHCDLHPRWDAQGKMVAFDSIHEGTRQIYICELR